MFGYRKKTQKDEAWFRWYGSDARCNAVWKYLRIALLVFFVLLLFAHVIYLFGWARRTFLWMRFIRGLEVEFRQLLSDILKGLNVIKKAF